jgi:DNA-binding transcriptional ArsR family regulator
VPEAYISALNGADLSKAARLKVQVRRREAVLALHVAGLNVSEIARRLDVGWRTVYRDLAEIEDSRVRVEEIFAADQLTAGDILDTLTSMHDADLADIVENPDAPIEELKYKPLSKWPAVWRRGLAGKIKVIPVSVRSSDGVQAGETKAWDKVGYKVEIERESLLKIMELSLKHKAVDGLAAQKSDVNVDVHVQVEERLTRARKVAAGLVVDVEAKEVKE